MLIDQSRTTQPKRADLNRFCQALWTHQPRRTTPSLAHCTYSYCYDNGSHKTCSLIKDSGCVCMGLYAHCPSEILWTTQILVSGLCSMELSPNLTPSFQLYISLQIGSKDASFRVPIAFSSLHCVDVCVCVWWGGGGRGGRKERERVCMCRWIHHWVPPLPPPFCIPCA